MIFWKKRNFEDLLLSPEEVMQALDQIRADSNDSLTRFTKKLKKELGPVFSLLDINHDSMLHLFVYRAFLKEHLSSRDVFELIVALNQDKGFLTREAFERLLDLMSPKEWNETLKQLITPSRINVPLMAGFVLTYPRFLERSVLEEITLRQYMHQALFHWNHLAKGDLQEHVEYFIQWMERKDCQQAIPSALAAFLDLNDLDLLGMIIEMVNGWLQSSTNSNHVLNRLFQTIQGNSFLGDFVFIGTLANLVNQGVVKRSEIGELMNGWCRDPRIDVRRMVLNFVPEWLKARLIEFPDIERMFDLVREDEHPLVRREMVSTIFRLHHDQSLSFDLLVHFVETMIMDSSPLVKESLFRHVFELDVTDHELKRLLEVLHSSWLDVLQGTARNDQLLLTSLKLLESFYRCRLVTAIQARHLIQPYFESSRWKIRHAATLTIPFLIREEIFTKDELRALLSQEKNDTVKKTLERLLISS